jgi:hypothetical protein
VKAYANAGGLKSSSVATIYFAQRGRYVKIGISRDPVKRVRALRSRPCEAPDDLDLSQPLRLLHTIPGSTLEDELAMHVHFLGWHAAGEWFVYDEAFEAALGDLLAHIEGRAA